MDIDANLTLFSYDVPATSITTAQPNAVLITQTMADAGQYRNFAVNITNDCGDVLTAK